MRETDLCWKLGCKEATRRCKKTGRTYKFDGKVYWEVRRDGLYPAEVEKIRGYEDWVGVK